MKFIIYAGNEGAFRVVELVAAFQITVASLLAGDVELSLQKVSASDTQVGRYLWTPVVVNILGIKSFC